ncbi:MAG: HAD hydrolase-like protein [Christensenella sp.]|nr:HAD hydrolase-like protein [Christensenella sp.]
MKYKTILFDFDGTLVDSSRGILECARYAMREVGVAAPPEQQLRKFIGPPLKISFMDVCGMDEEVAERAVMLYRERYAQTGITEIDVYPGIEELLEELNEAGFLCAVASVKMEKIVRKSLNHLDMAGYFSAICGASEDMNINTKLHIIHDAVTRTSSRKKDCILVGDSSYDAEGALQAKVDFCAVLWGFGFGNMDEALQYPCRYVAADTGSLSRFLLR